MPRAAKKYTRDIIDLARAANVDPRTAYRWVTGGRVLPAHADALERAEQLCALARGTQPRSAVK